MGVAVAKARNVMDEYAHRTNNAIDTADEIRKKMRFLEEANERLDEYDREEKNKQPDDLSIDNIAKEINELDFSKVERLTIDHKYVRRNNFKENLAADVDEEKAKADLEANKGNLKENEERIND